MSHHVIVYSTAHCQYCWELREYLHAKGVAFVEMDLDSSVDATREVQRITGDQVVPVIVVSRPKVGDEVVIGFNRQKLDAVLE
jgi:glutaredoxin